MDCSFWKIVLALVLFTACDPNIQEAEVPFEFEEGKLDFSNYVAVGDEITAGFQDNELFFSGQLNSYPSLLNTQFILFGDHRFISPFMYDDVGFGNRVALGYKHDCNDVEELTIVDYEGESNPRNFERWQGARLNNLGIPELKISDLEARRYHQVNPYWSRVAHDDNQLVLERVSAENPTFFTVWLGLNDILKWAESGGIYVTTDAHFPTSDVQFRRNLGHLLDSLMVNGAKGLIGNIPDITDFPFFELIPRNALTLTQEQADQLNVLYAFNPEVNFKEGENNFIVQDFGLPRHVKEEERILLSVDIDSIKCGGYGSVIPFGSVHVLLEEEIGVIKEYIAIYNNIIEELAAERNIPVVDFNQWYRQIQDKGILWNGVNTNYTFVTGGFFSMDGLFPTQRGAALIANEWLKVLEEQYGVKLPMLNPNEFEGVNLP
ncbi:SGNH/GDSL hydrolase family protein [Luteibaculum oceani]|nr:SGNH/GDSL hydrolase family protein [Luteibaculum oceani]